MLNYSKDSKRIEDLIKKCFGIHGLDLKFGTRVQVNPTYEDEHWVYPLLFSGRQIGAVIYSPPNQKVEVNAFPNVPLTLGEDYRKTLEDDLQDLVKILE